MRGAWAWLVGLIFVVGAAVAAVHSPPLVLVVPVILVSFAIRNHPRVALVTWLSAVYFVPFWTEVHFIARMPPPVFTAVFLLPAIIRHIRVRLTAADWVMLSFFTLCACAVGFVNTPFNELAVIILQWAPAYIIGRTLVPRAGLEWTIKVIAVLTMIISTWSIVEFVFHLHVFENYAGNAEFSWQSIQTRGAWERSEAAFGHSIALGAFIVAGTPFVLRARLQPLTRLIFIGAAAGGVFVTFSRGGQIGFVLAIILSLFFMRDDPRAAISRSRIGWGIFTLFALVFAVPFALSKFAQVSSDLDPSSAYRVDLLANLTDIQPIGLAHYFVFETQLGHFVYRGIYGSIDNAPLLLGLTFGWIPLLALAVLFLGACVSMVRGRASVSLISVMAAMPVILTASLITQWGGGASVLHRARRSGQRQSRDGP